MMGNVYNLKTSTDQGIVMTTGVFTKQAITHSQRYEITILNGNELRKLSEQYL